MFPCFVLASITSLLLGWLMGFLSVFLILLVLIQRGRGGGLTGALGGAGGQSAFGSKAGDTFTVITVVVASVWGFSCAFTMWLLGTHAPRTTVTDSSVTPGPGDRREVDDDAASRSLPSDSIRGLLDEEDDEAADGESNDSGDGGVTLTPAEGTSDEEPSADGNESADANESADPDGSAGSDSDDGSTAVDGADEDSGDATDNGSDGEAPDGDGDEQE